MLTEQFITGNQSGYCQAKWISTNETGASDSVNAWDGYHIRNFSRRNMSQSGLTSQKSYEGYGRKVYIGVLTQGKVNLETRTTPNLSEHKLKSEGSRTL
jgi:hypothetical protein